MKNQYFRQNVDANRLAMTKGQVLEMVTFNLAGGIAETHFLAAAEASNGALIMLPGFLGRRLVKAGDGSWIDIAEWRDAASAEAAGKVFHTLSQAEVFCSMIDAQSVKVSHHPIVTAG
jgi:hypothetical protein